MLATVNTCSPNIKMNHNIAVTTFNQARSTLTSLKSVVALSTIAAVFLAGCGGGSGDTSASRETTPPTSQIPKPSSTAWVVMGSSTAAGVGVTEGQRWSDLLQKQISDRDITVKNIARAGAVTYQALSTSVVPVVGRPSPDPAINLDYAITFKPTIIFVAFPTNDTAAGYSVDEIVKNFISIQDGAKAAGIKVIMLSTQPRRLSNSQRDQLRQINERLAAVAGSCYVNVHTPLLGTDGNLATVYDSGDGIHPNSLGHSLIFDRIMSLIKSGACVQI